MNDLAYLLVCETCAHGVGIHSGSGCESGCGCNLSKEDALDHHVRMAIEEQLVAMQNASANRA